MNSITAIIITLAAGLFLLLGSAIVFKTKNKEKVLAFSISLAIGVLGALAIFEILPEVYEAFREEYNIFRTLLFMFLVIGGGVLLLKVLDYFMPDHAHHSHDEKKNFGHIAFITAIAVFVHNVVEGIAIYETLLITAGAGIALAIGVGIHNIALGFSLSSGFYESNSNKKKTIVIMTLLSISTILGALVLFILGLDGFSEIVLGAILGVTLGMIIYIILFELLPEFKKIKCKKTKILGVILGIGIMLITMLIDLF